MPPSRHVGLLREDDVDVVVIEVVVHLGGDTCEGREVGLLVGEAFSFFEHAFEVGEVGGAWVGYVSGERYLCGTDELLRVHQSLEGIPRKHRNNLLTPLWHRSNTRPRRSTRPNIDPRAPLRFLCLRLSGGLINTRSSVGGSG